MKRETKNVLLTLSITILMICAFCAISVYAAGSWEAYSWDRDYYHYTGVDINIATDEPDVDDLTYLKFIPTAYGGVYTISLNKDVYAKNNGAVGINEMLLTHRSKVYDINGWSEELKNDLSKSQHAIATANINSTSFQFGNQMIAFDKKGSNVYIYIEPKSKDKIYFNINRDKNTLELDRKNKTEWEIINYSDGNIGFRSTKGKYYISFTSSGLGITTQSSYDTRFRLYLVTDPINNRYYVRFNDTLNNTSKLYETAYENNIVLPGVSGTGSGRFLYWNYEKTAQTSTVPGLAVFVNAYANNKVDITHGVNTLAIDWDKNACMELYSIYEHKLSYSIYENGQKINLSGVSASCQNDLNIGIGFASGGYIPTGRWMSVTLPDAESTGYNYKISKIEITGAESSAYALQDNNRTFRLNSMPDKDVDVKIHITKTNAAVNAESAQAYVGQYENSRTKTKLTAEEEDLLYYAVDDSNDAKHNTTVYSYYYTWETNTGKGWTTGVSSGNRVSFRVPDVDSPTTVQVRCKIVKERKNTGAKVTYYSSEISIATTKMMFPYVTDIYDKACSFDTVLVRLNETSRYDEVKNFQVKIDNGEWQDIEKVYTYYGDHVQGISIGISTTDGNPVGYSYTVTKNGTYTFRVIYGWTSETTKEVSAAPIVYKNIKSINSVSITDRYSGACKSDKILVMPGEEELIGEVKYCQVKFNDGDWQNVDPVDVYYGDHTTGISIGLSTNNGYPVGYSYTVTKNGTYTFRICYGKQNTIVTSSPVVYNNIEILSGIKVVSLPQKKNYIKGEVFDSKGLNVTAEFDNGTSRSVTDKVTIGTVDMSSSGVKTVRLSFEGAETTFNIRVYTRGDVSGDDRVNASDPIYMMWALMSQPGYKIPEGINTDYDGNGIVNAADAVYLLWHIFYPEEYKIS